MSKRGIIGRVTQLSRADVNDLIDSAADPQSVLDQLGRDFAANIADAEQAIAQLVCDLGANELDQEEDAGAVAAWSAAAEATSQAADLLRAEGVAAEADRLDDLARIALERQLTAEDDIKTVQHAIAAQTESIDILANGLHQMRIKLAELMHWQDKAEGRHWWSARRSPRPSAAPARATAAPVRARAAPGRAACWTRQAKSPGSSSSCTGKKRGHAAPGKATRRRNRAPPSRAGLPAMPRLRSG